MSAAFGMDKRSKLRNPVAVNHDSPLSVVTSQELTVDALHWMAESGHRGLRKLESL
jgi:hypothetical protein